MKKNVHLLSTLLGTALVLGFVSCNKGNDSEQPLPAAKITATKYYPEDKMTAYNIEYPSKDPFGKPVTLSGAITVGDTKWMKDMPAHENGAIDFALTIFSILIDKYGFDFWLLNEDTVAQMIEDFLKGLFE